MTTMTKNEGPNAYQAVAGTPAPAERRTSWTIVEIAPEGRFVTYEIGVSLNAMRDPKLARACVPGG